MGRPKSDDPKVALTIRVRSSVLKGFADTNAARAEIEAVVEARYAPGLRSELAKAVKTLGADEKRDRLGVQYGRTRPAFGSLLDKKAKR
jgi:hypothetical protein